jgi:hypothetical protein
LLESTKCYERPRKIDDAQVDILKGRLVIFGLFGVISCDRIDELQRKKGREAIRHINKGSKKVLI